MDTLKIFVFERDEGLASKYPFAEKGFNRVESNIFAWHGNRFWGLIPVFFPLNHPRPLLPFVAHLDERYFVERNMATPARLDAERVNGFETTAVRN